MAKAVNGKAEGDSWSPELIPVLLMKERSLDAVQKQGGKLEGPAESCLTQASVFQAASVWLTPAHLCGEGGAGRGGGNLWLGPPRTPPPAQETQGLRPRVGAPLSLAPFGVPCGAAGEGSPGHRPCPYVTR